MHTRLLQRRSDLLIAFLLLLLAAKFLWRPVVLGEITGFDAGINRYLFLHYAAAFPGLPDLEPWAREHAPGLFLLAAPLLQAGLPVDALLTWIWGLMPLVLVASLAVVTGKRSGKNVGVATFLMGLLSLPFYDAFAMMYWKTVAALLFTVWAYHFLSKQSPLGWVFLFLVFITHQQTALLAFLAIGTDLFVRLTVQRWSRSPFIAITLFTVALCIALLAYLPSWQEAVRAPLLSVLHLRGIDAPGGAFPSAGHYLLHSWPLYLLGAYGLLVDLRRGRLTLWHLSVLWAAVFVIFRLVFYRRFFLQLDFFLLPFAALGLTDLWKRYSDVTAQSVMILLVALQCWLAFVDMSVPRVTVDRALAAELERHEAQIPLETTVIALENMTATTLRGWLPNAAIRAPGLFGDPWTREQWETFLFGRADVRRAWIGELPAPSVLFVPPVVREHYGERVDAFLRDPCFVRTDHPFFLQVRDQCL